MTGYLTPYPLRVSPKATVVAKAADYTVVVADCGKIFTNTGAAGTVKLTLPKASDAAGCAIRVQLTAAQIVQAAPVTGEKVFLGGSGVASKYFQMAGVIGNYFELASDGVDWLVLGYSGVGTKEA